MLTLLTYPGIWDLAKENGAFTCLAKKCTTGNDLHKSVQRALAFVGQVPKEDRYSPGRVLEDSGSVLGTGLSDHLI